MVVNPKLIGGTSRGMQPGALWPTTAADATRRRRRGVWCVNANRPATATSGPWAFGSFRMVNVMPDLLLGEIEKHGQHNEKDEHLEAEPLALIEFGLSRPHQEG